MLAVTDVTGDVSHSAPGSGYAGLKLVYNDTLGAIKMCCYNQVVAVTRTFSTETIESVPAVCVVVKRLML